MAKNKNRDNRTSNLDDRRAAAIAHYKIAEFARLELPSLIARASPSRFYDVPVPPHLFAAIASFLNFIAEIETIRDKKIQAFLDVLQPPDPGEGGMPVVPPVGPTEASQKLREVLRLLAAAKAAAENLDPETARAKLKEAKDLMREKAVRQAFRDKQSGSSWYDILVELQHAIDFLNRVLK